MTSENPRTNSPTYCIRNVDVPRVLRYEEGHALTTAEANALNQLVEENTRNNLAQKWKKLADKGELPSRDALLAEATEYQNSYEFGVRRNGRTGAAIVTDPVEKEALRVAVVAVKSAMAKKGIPIKGAAEAINAKAASLVGARLNPEAPEKTREVSERIWAAAVETVRKMQEQASESDDLLAELGI